MSGARDKMWAWLERHEYECMEHARPCYKCRYFEPWPEDAQAELGMVGECVRYPPQAIGCDETGMAVDWEWPRVGCMATCGEWRKRKERK